MEYFDYNGTFELYMIAGLSLFTLWFIRNTIAYYKGEKRKVKHLHRFAKEGEAEAQQSLAQRYHKGDAVKKSCDRAAFWYQKAAFSGHDEAKQFLEKIRKKKRC
ncbi:MAG TPA: SEL1-like repeat protein [Sulfurovum sp.]|uniref:SEL1-like repeat protein n=1 Tax=Sulfurovum sp. TaxID=1969726 RepID=UPI002F92074E